MKQCYYHHYYGGDWEHPFFKKDEMKWIWSCYMKIIALEPVSLSSLLLLYDDYDGYWFNFSRWIQKKKILGFFLFCFVFLSLFHCCIRIYYISTHTHTKNGIQFHSMLFVMFLTCFEGQNKTKNTKGKKHVFLLHHHHHHHQFD